MATSLEEYIREQTQQYQRHIISRNKAKKVLQYQNNIRTFKTIPKQFLPQKSLQLLQPTTPIVSDFHEKYQGLFFEHLNNVISSNTITLELDETLLRQIVLHTEKHLYSCIQRRQPDYRPTPPTVHYWKRHPKPWMKDVSMGLGGRGVGGWREA